MRDADSIVAFVDKMPDLVKLTIVGMGIDPPTFEIADLNTDPTFVLTLDFLVKQGVAVATTAGNKRTYHLTELGAEVADECNARRISDGSIALNDNDEPGPEAA